MTSMLCITVEVGSPVVTVAYMGTQRFTHEPDQGDNRGWFTLEFFI